jgi:hypothetical protein
MSAGRFLAAVALGLALAAMPDEPRDQAPVATTTQQGGPHAGPPGSKG